MSADVETSVLLPADRLRRHCEGLLTQAGVSEADAAQTVDVFLQAELMGEESHGIRLLCQVIERVRAGGDRAATDITVLSERASVAHWDANRSLGQVTAARAMARAIDMARKTGVGLVAVRNGNSFTSAKYYPLMAADAGMVGAAFTNTSRKLMAPPGGTVPVLGNNPVAYAAPAGRYGAFVLDMACTAAAVERIVKANERGEAIPPGWALDAEGRETRDPAVALETLSLQPFGGYKAFNLAAVHEIFTSVLAAGQLFAGSSTGFRPFDGAMNTSFTMLAVDISAFQPRAEFEATMEQMIDTMKAVPLAAEATGISFAGERSQRTQKAREAEGIPLARWTFDRLNGLAADLGQPELT
ncbi:Ldh family oxidoreductase [Amorphus orientalis]|uniref:LDH2 family malate/lactate/ureidoglycolate dehydrogenase n=1 Tax=Amorphus orientalis TaxID=649198 RepID=A0AAE3VR89_9HYPH|nr:Ldh family oxidoreductase [Amorphus orientalis]MDQ0316862.1 LDH2 family malate/lactate/ureidoglycolate dehydrogenase [Amorphus orientalis]